MIMYLIMVTIASGVSAIGTASAVFLYFPCYLHLLL